MTPWTAENSERDGHTRPPDLLLRNMYAGQKATLRTGHGTTDWFQIGKVVRQSCLFCHPAYLTYMQSILGNTDSTDTFFRWHIHSVCSMHKMIL